MSSDQLVELNDALAAASGTLDSARKLIKRTQLDYHGNIVRIAKALETILEIQLEIYEHRPELKPDHLKPDWNSSAPPDSNWERED